VFRPEVSETLLAELTTAVLPYLFDVTVHREEGRMNHKDAKTQSKTEGKNAASRPLHAQRFDVSGFTGTGLSLRSDPKVSLVEKDSWKTAFRIL
jgi:hypothetical protein